MSLVYGSADPAEVLDTAGTSPGATASQGFTVAYSTLTFKTQRPSKEQHLHFFLNGTWQVVLVSKNLDNWSPFSEGGQLSTKETFQNTLADTTAQQTLRKSRSLAKRLLLQGQLARRPGILPAVALTAEAMAEGVMAGTHSSSWE